MRYPASEKLEIIRLVEQSHIAETPANDIEGVGIKLALYVYMSGVDPETADSAVEQVLSAYKDCVRVLGRDLLAEVKCLMPVPVSRACEQTMRMQFRLSPSPSRGALVTELRENFVDGLLRLGHGLFLSRF